MKNPIKDIIVIIMTLTMLLPIMSGCKKDDLVNNNENGFYSSLAYEAPEFMYVPEFIDLPDELRNIYESRFAYSEGRLIFSSITETEREFNKNLRHLSISHLSSINLDGTDFNILPYYTLPKTFDDNTSGEFIINSLDTDVEGNIWVLEYWRLYRYDIPEGIDPNENDLWEYYNDFGAGYLIRKLDPTGKEMFTVDISSFSDDENDYIGVYTFSIDDNNNIYITAWIDEGMKLLVLDSSGTLLFRLNINDKPAEKLIRLKNGTIALFEPAFYNGVNKLHPINYQTKTFDEAIILPDGFYSIFRGAGDVDLFFHIESDDDVYCFNVESRETSKLFNWIESDIIYTFGTVDMLMLPDEKIICVNSTSWVEFKFELIILTKVPYSDLPQRTVLTFAVFDMVERMNREAVINFNRTNPDFRIHLIDYSQFNTINNPNAGLERLALEITTGKVPDIYDVTLLPFVQYAQKGLFENVYNLIDNDPELNRSDFIEGAFRAAEIDGSLYMIFPSFGINTVVGNPAVLGAGNCWNLDDFRTVLNANPQADMPLGREGTKIRFIQSMIAASSNEYINWVDGTVHFDTPEFISLLELANDVFPKDSVEGDLGADPIISGRTIMANGAISDLHHLRRIKSGFGGDIVFKGFPSENKYGNTLEMVFGYAISAYSKNIDGAWQFLRTFLDKDWQLSNNWDFSTNREAFNIKCENAINEQNEHWFGEEGKFLLTQKDVESILNMLESTSGVTGVSTGRMTNWFFDETLMSIITESAIDYFNGRNTAENSARIIQNRVSIIVAERS